MLVAAAIEHAIEKGVTVHDTHSSRVHANVIWNLRGAGVYVEDGNEMNNTISENVVLCGDMPKHECKIPHAQHASGVGLYVIGVTDPGFRSPTQLAFKTPRLADGRGVDLGWAWGNHRTKARPGGHSGVACCGWDLSPHLPDPSRSSWIPLVPDAE